MLTQLEILATSLQQWQLEVLLSKAEVRVLAASRQIGKSLTLRALCVKEMMERPGLEILYLATTIKQVKAVGYRPMFEAFDTVVPKQWVSKTNRTELTAELVNGSRITFAGTENMEALRGLTADIIILDEFQSMPSDVFTIFEPIISARNGQFVIAGTAKGFNHFYDAVQKGTKGSATFTPGWRSWVIPITKADVPNRELRIEKAKRTMTPHAFNQEYMCSFRSLSGAVYSGYDVTASSTTKQLDPKRPIFIGIDFNVAKMCAVVAQRYIIETDDGRRKEHMHVIEEVVLFNTNTQKMAAELNRKYGQTWNDRIFIHPDASGSARKTSALVGSTDHSILKAAGFHVLNANKNPEIEDRVNTVNMKFLNAADERELFISASCTHLVAALTSQIYDPKTSKPEKGHGTDDKSGPVDALGYLVNHYYAINKKTFSVQHN